VESAGRSDSAAGRHTSVRNYARANRGNANSDKQLTLGCAVRMALHDGSRPERAVLVKVIVRCTVSLIVPEFTSEGQAASGGFANE
jgi:hypothetical protein